MEKKKNPDFLSGSGIQGNGLTMSPRCGSDREILGHDVGPLRRLPDGRVSVRRWKKSQHGGKRGAGRQDSIRRSTMYPAKNDAILQHAENQGNLMLTVVSIRPILTFVHFSIFA